MMGAINAIQTEHIELPELVIGPESVAFDGHGGGPYVSVSDGRILKYGRKDVGWMTFTYSPSYIKNQCSSYAASELPSKATESLCGRPLGLRFHLSSGYLYIADAYMGLMRVGPDGGEATVLATEAAGVPFSFTNGVDVDQVTGRRLLYIKQHHIYAGTTQDGHQDGRLHRTIIKYDPYTNQVTVLQSNVTYPNGIAISADLTHLIVSSTGPCKLLKVWIEGPKKAGSSEVFTNLSGYPDNIRPDQKGGYWVALHREKYELPFGPDSHLLAIRIGANDERLQDMRGSKGVRPTEVVKKKTVGYTSVPWNYLMLVLLRVPSF
jgi:sugar lactone lactonase YvrE